MTIQKNILTGALAMAGVVGLAACGGGSGDQDVGKSSSTPNRILAARAIDGYLAGATVYVDQNENGKLDAFEVRATTDNDGYFSYNQVTKTDYCAASVSANLAKHCLRAPIAANAEVLIRVTGGYDTVTTLPFEGTLSLRSRELDSGDLRLVTPLTSMTANMPSTQDKLQALIGAGIIDNGSGLEDDFFSELNGGAAMRQQLIATIVRSFGEAANAGTNHVFDDLEGDVWYSGYVAAAAKMFELPSGQTPDFTDYFSSPASIMDIVRKLSYTYMNPGGTMPTSFVLPNEAAASAIARSTAGLVTLSDELIQRMQSGTLTAEELHAALRVQALVAERTLQNPADPELPDLHDWVRNQLAQGNGLGTDLTGLGADDIDLSTLINPAFDFDPLSNSISASAVIPPAAAQAFASLGNTAIRVEVNGNDQRGAALVFIGGRNGATAGALDVCVRYRDNSGDFNTGNAGNPNGAMLVNGSWSLLNNHTLILNIEVAGGTRALMLKSVGGSGLDQEYRFDFGGDLSKWIGAAPEAFVPGAVPANDAACTTALIEAFGPLG